MRTLTKTHQINNLLVSFDSEVRKRVAAECELRIQTSAAREFKECGQLLACRLGEVRPLLSPQEVLAP